METPGASPFHTLRGYERMDAPGVLTPALEDYLEMTGRLCRAEGYARVGQLAAQLNVSPSSASKMVAKLAARGYLQYGRREIIRLTESGRARAAFLLRRHDALERFWHLLGIGDSLDETERVEHALDMRTLQKIETLLAFFQADTAARASLRAFQKKAEKS